jgi:hypothetical protein
VANATPVCTGVENGGLPLEVCGGRIFPEAYLSPEYIQYRPDPATGKSEFVEGIKALAKKYPRWVSITTFSAHFEDPDAVSMGPDKIRSYAATDTNDGGEIYIIKLTDHEVPDAGKETLFYSLSVHADEIGGREGGLRTVEDLAMAAGTGGTISDGVAGFESTTGSQPAFHTYPVSQVLANEAVYFVDFNVDGWTRGDHFKANGQPNPDLYTRGNWLGTDLNRQMPTVGWINDSRNPLEESEMYFGHKFMHEVADAGIGNKMAYGADIHGEGQSRAWIDIMYPAGQFDSVKHRRLMSIAQRTKSVVDDTLFLGSVNEFEEKTGGDAGEGIEDTCVDVTVPDSVPNPAPSPIPAAPRTVHQCFPKNSIPTKPARWGTVWDTLGYTDTGFIGDYLSTELGVTGMDYEMALNHADTRAYSRPYSYFMQENLINGTRAIIKTAMAYAMTERQEFADFKLETSGGTVGYVFDPSRVTDSDEGGSGTLPGPAEDGIGRNGLTVEQRPYSASQLDFFEEESAYVPGGMVKLDPASIAGSPETLKQVDTLFIADLTAPLGESGAAYDSSAYFGNLRTWVEAGGNLVLTDRALHALSDLNVGIPSEAVKDVTVYQPYSNIKAFDNPLVAGLRRNARQLAEYTLIGYGIGNNESPMTIVTKAAWDAAGGVTVGTTGNNAGTSDPGNQVSVGEISVGSGRIRILGGALHQPSEALDHRYGLKDYALSYSGLFILENAMKWNSESLGSGAGDAGSGLGGLPGLLGMVVPIAGIGFRRRRRLKKP